LQNISSKIKEKAKQLGFEDCGIIEARHFKEEEIHLNIWLNNNYNATMQYMEKNLAKRLNPKLLVENAKSIITVIYSYSPKTVVQKTKYKFAKYALSEDYHELIKLKLNQLFDFINLEIKPINGKCFVDSSPVLEKAVARRAGLGWIGKNSLLLTKKGSFFWIGEIICDLEMEYDKIFEKNFCGNCQKCIDACPTKAIYENYKLDANKCFAYQSIENKGEIPEIFVGKFENIIYGCDICQDVCPWNNKSIPNIEPNPEIMNLTDDELENITNEEFNRIFKKSSIKRIKLSGLKRNIDFANRKLKD